MLCQTMRLDLPGAQHSTSTPVSKMPTSRRGTQTHSFHTHWPVEERAPKSSGSYPEALGSSRKPFCKDFVVVLLHRGSPRSSEKLPEATRKLLEAPGSPFAKTSCLYCSTGEGPEAPQSSRKLPKCPRVHKHTVLTMLTEARPNARWQKLQCSQCSY